jgi:hypothetical protein
MSAISHNGNVAGRYFSRLLQPARVSATVVQAAMPTGAAIVVDAGPGIEERDDVVAISGRGDRLDSVSVSAGNILSGRAAPTPTSSTTDRRSLDAAEVAARTVTNPQVPERTQLSEIVQESVHGAPRLSPATRQADASPGAAGSLDSSASQSGRTSTSEAALESTTHASTSPVRNSPAGVDTAHPSQSPVSQPNLSKSDADSATPPAARDMLGQVLRWVATAPDHAASAHAEAATDNTTIVRPPMSSAFQSERQAQGVTMPPQAARSPSLVPLSHPSGSNPLGAKTAGGQPVAALEEVVRLSIGDIRVRVEPPAAPALAQPAQSATRATPSAAAFATASGLRRRCIHL